jgi:hypothetical protein
MHYPDFNDYGRLQRALAHRTTAVIDFGTPAAQSTNRYKERQKEGEHCESITIRKGRASTWHRPPFCLDEAVHLPLQAGRDRPDRRSGGTLPLQGGAEEGEFEAPVARQLFQIQVLEDVDAVAGQQHEVAGQRAAQHGVHRANHIPGHVVSTYRSDSYPGQPFRGAARYSEG